MQPIAGSSDPLGGQPALNRSTLERFDIWYRAIFYLLNQPVFGSLKTL